MADSPILKIPLLSTSQAAKEATINTMVSYLERAMNDAQTVAMSGGSVVLPLVDLQRYFMFRLTGAGSGSVLNITRTKRLFVVENLTGAFDVTVHCVTSSLVVKAGAVVIIYCDGTNLISVADSTVMGGGPSGPTTFIALLDTFATYANQAGKWLVVNEDEDGIETMVRSLANLTDVDLTALADGYVLAWSVVDQKFIPVPQTGGGGGSAGDTGAIIKPPVDVASVAELDITEDLVIGTVLDGVTLAEGTRVLLKDQSNLAQNGIWEITSGAAVRPDDSNDVGDFIEGTLVVVRLGAENGLRVFVQTETAGPGGISPGSSPMNFDTSSGGSLSTLSDVDPTGLADGQVLIWDDTLQKWIPGNGGGSSLPPISGNANKVLAVNPAGNAVVWIDPPASYPPVGGNSNKFLAVKEDESGVQWKEPPVPIVNGTPFLSIFIGGLMGPNEILFRWIAPQPFTLPIALVGSQISADKPSTAAKVLSIRLNGTQIGTLTWAASGTIPTVSFTSAVTLAPGDILSIVAPATADVTLGDITIVLRGNE